MDTIDLDGRRIEFFSIPPPAPDRPTLVFLHEGLGCAAMWRDFPSRIAIATRCGALVYSRFGYGGSSAVDLPRPLEYMHHEGEHVLPALLDALAVRDAILLGHSDGASIALIHAGTLAARPRVRALIVEAPHVFCEDISVASIARARDAYEHGDLRARLARWHGDNVDGAFRGWNDAWLDPRFRAWNIERYLPAIAVPVLMIQGADDEYGTLAQLESIERHVPSPTTRVVLAACGHSPHRDQPALTAEAIERFLA